MKTHQRFGLATLIVWSTLTQIAPPHDEVNLVCWGLSLIFAIICFVWDGAG